MLAAPLSLASELRSCARMPVVSMLHAQCRLESSSAERVIVNFFFQFGSHSRGQSFLKRDADWARGLQEVRTAVDVLSDKEQEREGWTERMREMETRLIAVAEAMTRMEARLVGQVCVCDDEDVCWHSNFSVPVRLVYDMRLVGQVCVWIGVRAVIPAVCGGKGAT